MKAHPCKKCGKSTKWCYQVGTMVVYYCFDHMDEVLAPIREANQKKKQADAFTIDDYGVTDAPETE